MKSTALALTGQSIEVVNLLGSGPVLDIDAVTGEGDQTINGNAGNNLMDGGAGADTMTGGAGNDTYWADVNDTLEEQDGEGFDTVHTAIDDYVLQANFEGLVLEDAAVTGTGNDVDNTLIGNNQNNVLSGNAGNDILAGWRGNDLLQGGSGNDTYAFSRGDGQDTIDDLEGSGKLHFSGDITRADLRYSLSGNDLIVNVAQAGNTTTDSVTLKNWVNAAERTNVVAFCGGDTFALDESIFNHARWLMLVQP
jgi:Ca2+-binding RTX toxin-like protein